MLSIIIIVIALTVGEGRARSAAKSAVLCPTKSGPVSGIARGPVYARYEYNVKIIQHDTYAYTLRCSRYSSLTLSLIVPCEP